MIKAIKLKIDNEFIELYPISLWYRDSAFVGIHYGEFKIKKVNPKTILAFIKGDDNNWSGTYRFNRNSEFKVYSKEETIKIVLKNTPIILKSYRNQLLKYTEVAFEHWYLKAQIRMIEIIFDLVENNNLNLQSLNNIKYLIDKENNILTTKLKELK